MEQMTESTDECCIDAANENMKDMYEPVQAHTEQENLHSNGPNYIDVSDISISPTASSVSHSDEKLDQSNSISTLEFMAVTDDNVYVPDSRQSVVRSLSDDSIHFGVEDNFTRGGNMTMVKKCDDENVCDLGHSELELQFAHDEQLQCDMLNTTYLSCSKDVSERASGLSLLASRVKALCNVMTVRYKRDENGIFALALYSTQLENSYIHHSPEPGSIRRCDLVVTGICISFGQGHTTKEAKRCACSNAVKVLQKPYLHLEERSQSDNMLRLVGSGKPSVKASYNIVTRIDISSNNICLPVLDVINFSDQQIASDKMKQLVVSLKHLISTVRTIFHVLQTVKKNKKIINMAMRIAKVPIKLQNVHSQQFCCKLFVDVVLVAFAEAGTRKKARENVYTAAVEIFCKPYLCLDCSELGGPIRLVGSEEPFDEMPSGMLATPQNYESEELDPQEPRFVTDEKLPSCAYDNSVLPDRGQNNMSQAEMLGTENLPSIMACFHRLSNKVKALFKDTATVKNAATVMALAIKESKLPCHTRVTKYKGHGYYCQLYIVSVFVASGEAARRVNAIEEAYVNAAKLLQKSHLRLTIGHDSSTVLVGFDEPFVEVPCTLQPQQAPEIGVSTTTITDPVFEQRAENSKCHSSTPYAQKSVQSDSVSTVKCPSADISTVEISMAVEEKHMENADNSEVLSNESSHAMLSSTLLDQPHVNITGNKPDVQTLSADGSVEEKELTEYQKTVVIARSHNDLSRLVNRFHSLAHIAKDIYAMFDRTKSVKDMFEMALHMSYMCSKSEVIKLRGGCVRCQLSIDDVLVAVVENSDKKSAKIMAYSTAAELLRMPFLCLEEKDSTVRLIGSEEPFIDMSLEPHNVKVTSSANRGFWQDTAISTAKAEERKDSQQPLNESLRPHYVKATSFSSRNLCQDSGIASADVEEKKDSQEPLNKLTCNANLSKLVICIHGLACRVKAVIQSAMKFNNGMDIIQKALVGSKMHLTRPIVPVVGVGYQCELFVDGVEIACGNASRRKEAQHAAYNAAVGLLKMPYLRLQEDPEHNQSFKLIGSEQPFVGVLSGVLPCDQNCILNDKGKFVQVELSAGFGESTGNSIWHSSDRTYNSSKLKTVKSFEKSDLSKTNCTVPPDERGLCKTQISAVTCTTNMSELVMVDKMPSSTLSTPQNDKSELELQEALSNMDEKLPSFYCDNSELPADENYAAVCDESHKNLSPAVMVSTADFPAIMACFRHMSDKVKALFKDTATVKSDATIEALAKLAKLLFHTHVSKDRDHGTYQCELHIAYVFVASGKGASRLDATEKAYVNAANLLKKSYLHLALGHDSSAMLVGSDEPFVEVPPKAMTIIDPVTEQKAENSECHSSALTPFAQKPVQSDSVSTEECPSADTSTAEISMPVEEKHTENADNSEILSSESPHDMSSSTLLDQSQINICGNKPDVQTLSADDSVELQELTECQKTVVIARSHNDLSRLVNRFNYLACIAKDIYAMFNRTKSVMNMFEMALHMSYMCSKTEVVYVGCGRVRCQLSIDDVLVAFAETYDEKYAKIMAYSTAAELIRMPFLCLEEKRSSVRLIGSQKPFTDVSLKSDNVKVTSSSSRGLWHASGMPLHESLNELQCNASLSKLIIRLHNVACRVKAVSQSAVKFNNGIEIIQKALGSKLQLMTPVVRIIPVIGIGYQCELFLDGVEIACGDGFRKKEAKHEAYDAAVVLLKKPCLRLQEDPERNQSFKLVGSEKPFVGVLYGVLPYHQNCVRNDKGQFVQVELSAGSRENTDSGKWHSSKTHDSSKLKSETCVEKSAYFSRSNGAVLPDGRSLCKTQISAVTCSTDTSELVNLFQVLADRVKYIFRSSLEVHSGSEVFQMALVDTQMQKKILIVWMSSTAFRCELTAVGVVVAYGKGDTKEQAKQAAYSAAVELLNKPYLQLQENSVSKRPGRLVGSDEPFASVSSGVFPYQQNFVSDERNDREKRPTGNQRMSMDKNLANSADEKELPKLQQHVETVPAHCRLLSNFVILQNHFKKKKSHTSMLILQQSADFNKWELNYDLTEVEGGRRCRLTLGSHTLGDAVGIGKGTARTAAAEQAMYQLTSMCYTLKVKKYDLLANALTRNEVWIIIEW